MQKWIYHFNQTKIGDLKNLKTILGGKGAGLSEMVKLGLKVPQGFTITSNICKHYYDHNSILPQDFSSELELAIKHLELSTNKTFGTGNNPLLVAVRSGATDSMPGMMDSVLNLGMNDSVVESIANLSGNQKFAYDSYRRFLQMYGSIVLEIPNYLFEDIYYAQKFTLNIEEEDLNLDTLKNIVTQYKKIIKDYTGHEIESNPQSQLIAAIEAVIRSWMSERASTYRKIHNINDDLGTAVNIQQMVFGNIDKSCATGVVFTRNPSTGNKKIFGEYLINAQGEDVVSGTRTPELIENSMSSIMPKIYHELQEICEKLEKHYKDVQDIEFTVENNVLYILQTRSAKRTVSAAIKIAVDMVSEELISKEEAIMRIDPSLIGKLLHSSIDYSNNLTHIATGLPASPGAASGIVCFSSNEAAELATHHKVILIRNDTSPDDIKGIHLCDGILTARGGMTSHAAVVARGMGKPCICSVNKIYIDEKNKKARIADVTINAGDVITIDGSNGKIFLGHTPLIEPDFSAEFNIILEWADEISKLKVRANAENEEDAITSMKFGALGIGLCRSEHMFFDKDKIPLIQEMIITSDENQRIAAINALLPKQAKDFYNLFQIVKDKPINIRLLDPPLHEFLPKTSYEQENLAKRLKINLDVLKQRLETLHEVNPMLGHRGCRLGISYPEIYKMQINAIAMAAEAFKQEQRIKINLEIMIPFVSNIKELNLIKEYVNQILKNKIEYTLGTMIELPRATLIAEEIAKEVDYFSFGTNDLTQTTYGISRDDIGSFLSYYLEHKIFQSDPFIRIDEDGVGALIKLAIKDGKKSKPSLKLGVCGEHAGDPKSIDFFHEIGIDYISCSPFRIPIARIAAAQSEIKNRYFS